MAETLILDPSAIAVSRSEWDITQHVAEAGPDWGDAAIEQFLADSEIGSVPVDFRIPNRTITVPLLLLKSRYGPGYSFEQVRRRLQQKVSQFQREGGWISRTTASGTVFADVIGASLKLGGSTAQALWGIDADAVLTLTCLPDWYGNEVDAGTFTGSVGSSELIFLISNVIGSYPARVRVKVDELDGNQQRGLLWSFNSRRYSAASTALPVYPASVLTPYIYAGPVDDFGWRTVLSTDLAAGPTPLTHAGTYRFWARINASGAAGTQVRLVWDVGDLVLGVENAPVVIPALDDYWLVSLGDVHLDPAPVGTHRWRGVIQHKSPVNDSITVDKIWLQPIEESAGYVAAPLNTDVNLAGYAVHDEFEQTAGALTGKSTTRDTSATWTARVGSDTDDFTVDATNKRVTRSSVSDSASRIVYLTGAGALTDTAAKVDVFMPAGMTVGATLQMYLVFRYVDANNYAYMTVVWNQSAVAGVALAYFTEFVKVVGGVPTEFSLAQDTYYGVSLHNPINTWSTMRVMVTKAGYIAAWWYPQGSALPKNPTLVSTTQAATFATGSPLAAGYCGFGDYYNSATLVGRFYDNFAEWVPDADAILFANGTAELRYDGHFRVVEDGIGYGPVSQVVGDLPRLPASGIEVRPVQVMLKPTSSDLNWVPDFKQSKIKAQVLYRPCHLFAP